jgi:hypothetical protein
MRTVYYVAEEDPAKAEAIIAKFMAPNEKVEAYGPLPEAAVKALGLKPGEFSRWWSSTRFQGSPKRYLKPSLLFSVSAS